MKKASKSIISLIASLPVARVKLEPQSSSSHEPSSSQGSTFIFFIFFFLLLMSSGCYSLLYNDVLVINGKKITSIRLTSARAITAVTRCYYGT